jgi:hypothetical protein
MLGRLLSIVVLLGFILPPQPPKITTANPNTEYKLYLPLSINTYPYVEALTLGNTLLSHIWIRNCCVYGYTIALTPSAVYSVTLAVDVINTNVTGTDYITTDYISPMLDATLPDQKNPFYYCRSFIVTEPGHDLGGVKVVSSSLNPPSGRVIYPLTITNWEKKVTESGTTISGTVRNDSGHRLVDIRVVGISSAGLEGICWYSSEYEAEVESTTLDPGEKADFSNMYCTEGVSEISAQGVAEP